MYVFYTSHKTRWLWVLWKLFRYDDEGLVKIPQAVAVIFWLPSSKSTALSLEVKLLEVIVLCLQRTPSEIGSLETLGEWGKSFFEMKDLLRLQEFQLLQIFCLILFCLSCMIK